jgi:hypothetical protein
MSESKKKRTEIEKLKEEKNGVEKELAEAMKKQEQIAHPQSIILVGGGSGQKKKEAGASSKSYSKSLKLY